MAQVIIKGPATVSMDDPLAAAAPVAASAPPAVASESFGANGPRQLAPGIFAPVPTFFDHEEELDLATLMRHVVRLAEAGVGSVVAGSNGEAAHLMPNERTAVVKAARQALDAAGYANMPLISGAGAGSTFETIQNCKAVAAAGADYALILTQHFYSPTLKAEPATVLQYYHDVATHSPLPILLYSYPAVSGIDITSEQMLELAKNPQIVGAKLTCANVGKLVRVASITAQPTFVASGRAGFFLYCGYSDFLLPSLLARSSGAITGLANVAPRVIKRLFDMGVRAITTCDAQELRQAQELQDIVSRADAALAAGGIASTKYFLQAHFHYGGAPRRPLPRFSNQVAIAALEKAMHEILALEISLSQ